MTGFGKSEISLPTKKISVEVRSLNSKQLDLTVKLPGIYRPFEFDIRSIASAAIVRGKADVTITVENTAANSSASINKEVFREYIRQINEALTYTEIYANSDTIVPVAMRMPDVVSTQVENVSEQEQEALIQAVKEALQRFTEFREQEGATLIADLLTRVDKIEDYKLQVEPYEKSRCETIKNRIRENLAQLKIDVDSNRLEQEMIFYIE